MKKNFNSIEFIEKIFKKGLLSHAVLFVSNNKTLLENEMILFSKKILNDVNIIIDNNINFFEIKPCNKMNQINIKNIRDLISNIFYASKEKEYKVILIHEAEKMNLSSSNAILKTLENPPNNTIFIFSTTKEYLILNTIRSRCIKYTLYFEEDNFNQLDWTDWIKDYLNLIQLINFNYNNEKDLDSILLKIYNLINNFSITLNKVIIKEIYSTKNQFKKFKKEELIIEELKVKKEILERIFTSISYETYNYYITNIKNIKISHLFDINQFLEKSYKLLLNNNLNENTALEYFLLKLLTVHIDI